MDIISLLASDAYLIVNKDLARAVGLDAAVLFGELSSELKYWESQDKVDEEGYFFSTVENVENMTALTDYQQRKALKKLKDLGLIDTKLRGLPAKRYIKINSEQVLNFFQNCDSKNLRTVTQKTKELEVKKLKGNNNNITIINNNNKKNNKESISSDELNTPAPKPKKPIKHKYGEYEHVTLTDLERDKLFSDYGEVTTMQAIKYLDEYIEMKGYKHKSSYLALRKWVFDALDEQEQRKKKQPAINWDEV